MARSRIGFWSWIWSVVCDNVVWRKKWLVDFNAGKAQPVSFEQSNYTSAIDVKMGESVLEKSSFKMFGWAFSSKLGWGSYIIFMLKVLVVASLNC